MFNCFAYQLLFSSFVNYIKKRTKPASWRNNLFELQNLGEHNTTNIQIAPDYLTATATMLVIFWKWTWFLNYFWLQDSTTSLVAELWFSDPTTNLKTYEKVKNFL